MRIGAALLLVPIAAGVVYALDGEGNVRPGREGGELRFLTVAQGLEGPTGLAFRPGDPKRVYVAEQTGRIRIVADGQLLPRPFLDLRQRVLAGGERGLLGLAFAPDHARSGLLYVHYTNRRGDTRVVRYHARGDRVDPGSAQTLLSVRQPYENHNGGQLAFDRRGRLHVGLGDGGSAFDPERRGQDLATPLGKVLRRDGVGSGAEWKTVAYGLRNPWRFSFDRASGDLWIADVGQDRQEEIDFLPAGERGLVNFGWSAYEGTYRWRTREVNPRGRLAGPVTSYGRRDGCSVTGGYVYRGRALPRLRGRYLYGDLCRGTIWSLRRRPGARPGIRREPVKLPLLTSFAEDQNGELHAVSLDGRVVALRGAGGDEVP